MLIQVEYSIPPIRINPECTWSVNPECTWSVNPEALASGVSIQNARGVSIQNARGVSILKHLQVECQSKSTDFQLKSYAIMRKFYDMRKSTREDAPAWKAYISPMICLQWSVVVLTRSWWGLRKPTRLFFFLSETEFASDWVWPSQLNFDLQELSVTFRNCVSEGGIRFLNVKFDSWRWNSIPECEIRFLKVEFDSCKSNAIPGGQTQFLKV